ncbi:autotransporter outer membrane beta-barrel domain-containing protein [Halomonas sp. H10-59]|uniref:Autotransporter outer membrane beta-barrel domain-containing protein n=1 Tax=Halomonas sp. H10-59 TaxID=2950874 RepID=A0AAU7KTG2_9GAMM
MHKPQFSPPRRTPCHAASMLCAWRSLPLALILGSASSSALALDVDLAPLDQSPTTFVDTLEDRPLTLELLGQQAVTGGSRVFVRINDRPVTLRLPAGITLAEVDGQTPVVLTDGEGKVLLAGRLDALGRDGTLALADALGLLELDQTLYGAQKQAMAQNFRPVTQRIDATMAPLGDGPYQRPPGISVWSTAEIGDLDGDTRSSDYSGDGKVALLGIDYRYRNLLVGVAAGKSEMYLDGKSGGHTDLGGEMVAPYAAIALLNDRLVLDATLLFQDLDGNARRDYLVEGIDLDGDRWGARGAATYHLPSYQLTSQHRIDSSLTLGGTYLDDDVDGDYLQGETDYGEETGEVFAGVRLGADVFTGRLFGGLLYHYDVSSDVDDDADFLEGSDDDRTVLELGATQRLGRGVDVTLAGQATLGSSATEYDMISASLSYDF